MAMIDNLPAVDRCCVTFIRIQLILQVEILMSEIICLDKTANHILMFYILHDMLHPVNDVENLKNKMLKFQHSLCYSYVFISVRKFYLPNTHTLFGISKKSSTTNSEVFYLIFK